MRDITKSVQSSAAMPGNRTNPQERGKSRKPADRLDSHKSETAHAVGDTRVFQDSRLVAVRKSNARHIVRNADGSENVQDTLAVLQRLRLHNASKRREGKNA